MSDDIIHEALERYDQAQSAWDQVRNDGLEDLRFSMLGEQWPETIREQRKKEGRPCLTINHMPKFIRQVVNDARQNRPSIKVRPVDSNADIKVAEVYDGIIRHIESTSDADICYDTAVASAIGSSMGFFRIDVDYACDDTFDLDIRFGRILNQFSVLFDPFSQAADSSDWRFAFVMDDMPKTEFEAKYPGAEATSFEGGNPLAQTWFTENSVRVAEYWTRDEIEKTIWKMSDGQVVDEANLADPEAKALFEQAGITATTSRKTKSYKVTNRLITGAGELEKKAWPGTIIPIVPVFGEETNIEGRRIFQSLIYHGKDAQRSFNFWRSAGAELIALAPKTPWVGKKGFVGQDPKQAEKWGSANTESHAYLEYDGALPPERQPFAGVPAGVLQEANLAAEDMRTIIGISNPGLGVPDPREISGRALRMRRTESDQETYHFHDNLNRSVRCAGRILVELIPKVYSQSRVIRILGLDGKHKLVPVNQDIPQEGGPPLRYDLTTGKYDVVVDAGPSFTTKREEAAESMTAFISAFPPAAPILGDMIARNSDWPEAEKVADRLSTMLPPAIQAKESGQPLPPPQPPPEVQIAQMKAQADIEINKQKTEQDAALEQQKAQNQQQREMVQANADIAVMRMKTEAEIGLMREKYAAQMELERQKTALSAELDRMRATASVAKDLSTPQAAAE